LLRLDAPSASGTISAPRSRRQASHHHRTIDWKFRVHDARHVFRYEAIKAAQSEH
jgi:hypothetical protein